MSEYSPSPEEQVTIDRAIGVLNGLYLKTYGELMELTRDLLDLVEPCDRDPQRDYCVTHHQRNCRSDELVRRLRELMEELDSE